MAPEPFLTLALRSCRDLVHVRYRARQVAQLLQFPPQDVLGIAAGAFVVAEQARALLKQAYVCFALVDRHLRVFARPLASATSIDDLTVLSKALPTCDQQMAADDIAWIIRQVQLLAPMSLAEELIRQNREVLELLTALRQRADTADPSVNPSAA